ncbi:hypothetical protein CW708_03130 [Candidatus Bathyarchaeota archaeon]|nr:MAG: hypothetical protein CW708_03130 [Candidatus Bathyarchaeota archaeon]
MIESYDFGVMVVNGKRYNHDLIIFPERIMDNWWRKEGHKLTVKDLDEVLAYTPKPEFFIFGTGYYGLVKVSPEVKQILETKGIEFIAKPTKEASEVFNKLLKLKKRVIGAFHLTC